jgi:hypothetical protein
MLLNAFTSHELLHQLHFFPSISDSGEVAVADYSLDVVTDC